MASQTKEKRSSRRFEQSERAPSIGSPHIITREQEKDQLVHLNDRLAAYIDKVRSLELENNRLQLQISSIEETVNSERSNIREVYEKELEDARRLLDETAGEKARLQIEAGKYRAEVDDLKPRVKKLEKDLNAANHRIGGLESSLAEKDGRNRALANEKRNLEDQLNDLRKELEKKDKQLLVAKKQVEEETVVRVDLENRLQSLKEELAFKEQLYKEELKEHSIKQTVDFSSMDLGGDINTSLLDSLQELRDQHNEQADMFRSETENLYTSKLNDLKTIAERYRNQYTKCHDELREIKSSQDDKDSEITALRAQNDALVARIKDLEKQMRIEHEIHREALDNRDKELQNMREAMAEQLKMYQELMNIKLTLDAEITTYRKLLEGEETRLRIDSTPPAQKKTPKKQKTKGPDRSQRRGQKRRRVEDTRSTVHSSTAAGVVAIEDSDPEGEYIKLHNTSETDQPLGGWVLKRSVDGGDEATYKFTSKYVLKGGAEVTVWSTGSGEKQDLPTDIVGKNVESWGVGEKINTTLIDASGEVMASRNLLREVVQYEDTTYPLTDLEVGKEELFHQQGDPEEKRCAIM
ncbi:lamin-B2.L-like isoform X3 [Apostichopus japonicus]|uniref:lamin-B2.L-like isoform X3 n=1 Tax=Stichopus japonicus TaxID=307972 RepID=UPI003AB1F285